LVDDKELIVDKVVLINKEPYHHFHQLKDLEVRWGGVDV
jgi:hypothetical protein